jgi:hypothetical protein
LILSKDIYLVFWEDGKMKTTLDIPDDLYRAAKAKAALENRKIKDLVAEALTKLVYGPEMPRRSKRRTLPLVKTRKKGSLHLTNDLIARTELNQDAERSGLPN